MTDIPGHPRSGPGAGDGCYSMCISSPFHLLLCNLDSSQAQVHVRRSCTLGKPVSFCQRCFSPPPCCVGKCFSNRTVRTHHWESRWTYRPGSGDLGWGPRLCISNKPSGDPGAACSGFRERWTLGKVFLPEAESGAASQGRLNTFCEHFLPSGQLPPNIQK